MFGFLTEEHELLRPERECRLAGFCFIAGVDEVGRGPLAGPVVAAAVRFPEGAKVPAVFDSKQLSESAREELDAMIRSVEGVDIGIGEISASEIDEVNILKATYRAMNAAAHALKQVDFLLIDGNPTADFGFAMKSMVKGDARCASIAAASIVAKVYRDRLMTEMEARYPGYGFAKHKGYGTAEHLAALRDLGPCAIHRRSFAPVRDILNPPPEQLELF